MRFKSPVELVDPQLGSHLANADLQIENVYKIEESYLTLKSAKDTKFAILYIQSPIGTVEQKKSWVNCHKDWTDFSTALAQAEALYHKERNRLAVRMEYINAAKLTMRVEQAAIKGGVGG